jgi:hypothetical protein
VRELVHEIQPAGRYTVRFETGGLASGIYFYRLQVGKRSLTRKMLLLR